MAKKLTLRQAQAAQGQQSEWVYNALDAMATREISDTLWDSMDETAQRTHDFYMALQGPAMEMTTKGIKVDEIARQDAMITLHKELAVLERQLAKDPMITAIWDKLEKVTGTCAKSTRKDGKHTWTKGVPDTKERLCVSCGKSRMKIRPFKPSSDDDKMHLLYDLLKMRPQLNKDHKVTADKEARSRLKNKYPKHEELIQRLDDIADASKQLDQLDFRMTTDGRFKASFNVGVTSTGRWSSNKDPFGHGGNSQNLPERLRHIFIADPGMELCYADLKQAESNVIAHEAGDEAYIEAHVIGDTHTYVTRLMWPEGVCGKEWTWEDIGADKKIATSCSPPWDNKPGHDYRFQSKSIQHGTNLGRTAFGIAIKQHVPVEKAREGQRRYHRAFPGIRNYQNDIKAKVENQEPIFNALGVRFKLFGRPWDDHTVRQGLAVKPQSTVGHVIGIGCWYIDAFIPEIDLLAQVHDAVLFQFPKGQYEYVRRAMELMRVPLPIQGVDGKIRTTIIEVEAAVGQNWGHKSKDNPDGISEITFHSDNTWSIK